MPNESPQVKNMSTLIPIPPPLIVILWRSVITVTADGKRWWEEDYHEQVLLKTVHIGFSFSDKFL